MYQNPQLRASPQLEEDILIMLEGISGDIIKYPRLLKGSFLFASAVQNSFSASVAGSQGATCRHLN